MPELPEVQTVVDDLRRLIKGWEISDFSSSWKKNVNKGNFSGFRKEVVGKKIIDVYRKGKWILLKLDSGKVIVLHLRMTGALIASESILKHQNANHIRHNWILQKTGKKKVLYFSDVRKFATVELVENDDHLEHKGLCSLGLDPFSEEFTKKAFADILKKSKERTIRNVLLDQSRVCGIGNIYASEILFDVKIHPEEKCFNISADQTSALHKSIIRILQKAIERRGTSFSDYRDSHGKKGGFQKLLKVYNRNQERCLKKGCPGIIKKAKLQGRSAFWCPVCQSLSDNNKK